MIPFIGPIIGAISSYVTGKQEISKAKQAGELKIIAQAAESQASWELLHAKGSQTSWKDEFWTIIFAVPLVLGFTGDWGVEVVTAGFLALDNMPDWYQYTLVTLVLAAFGIRMKDNFFKKG